ncbi:MAG: recombinase [Bacteroidia bacterium]|nr:recombinase [Bacteroidia bacterium]
MATIKAFVRSKQELANVRFRLLDGQAQLYYKSKILVSPKDFDEKNGQLKRSAKVSPADRAETNEKIRSLQNTIISVYERNTPQNSEQLTLLLNGGTNKIASLADIIEMYTETHKLKNERKKHYHTIKNKVLEFEEKNYKISLSALSYKDIQNLYNFISSTISENTAIGHIKKIRAVVRYAVDLGYIKEYPFKKFKISKEIYGTPQYLTMSEVEHLYNYDFANRPKLAVQRDIFVFQCLIGCRVGNLIKLTKNNINDGILEYIPLKTIENSGAVVRVPLHKWVIDILNKYKDLKGDKLLPFISQQKYNDTIKDFFEAAGLNRTVTILNPRTRTEEKRKLCEIASSHMARRTFIGNLYKQVQDPNLIGSMSGHVEGSRAFARYRQIDDDIKKNIISLLE